MPKDYTVFNIPASAFNEPESFDAPKKAEASLEVTDVYTELNNIAEELEECRLRNC